MYNELAKQLETQLIKVKEDTPIFMVLKPVTVPVEKSKPNRPLTLIFWTFLGGVIGVLMVFGRRYYVELNELWNSKI